MSAPTPPAPGPRPTPAGAPARPTPPWSLAHLPPALLVMAILTAVVAPIAGLIGDGWGSAAASAAGFALVSLAFCLSSVVVAIAGGISDAMLLPAALSVYLLKVVVLGVVLVSLQGSESIDTVSMAWSVAVGTIVWVIAQCVRYAITPMYYVDYIEPK